MRYPAQNARRAATNTIAALGMILISAAVRFTLSAVVATRNKTNCCNVFSTTRPLIWVAASSFCSVGSIASLRKRLLPTIIMVTVPRWAWVLIKRTLRCQRYCDPDHHPYELRQDRDPGFLRQGLLPCA